MKDTLYHRAYMASIRIGHWGGQMLGTHKRECNWVSYTPEELEAAGDRCSPSLMKAAVTKALDLLNDLKAIASAKCKGTNMEEVIVHSAERAERGVKYAHDVLKEIQLDKTILSNYILWLEEKAQSQGLSESLILDYRKAHGVNAALYAFE